MNRSAAGYLSAALIATAAGCAGTQEAGSPAGPPPDHAAVVEPDAAALALGILSERLGVPEADIELVESGATEWRDSSLGCPRPGWNYRPVITPGHYAVLRHGGKTWRVHMANGRGFVCERSPGEAAANALVPKLALPVDKLQALARLDLARRLDVPVDDVQPTGARSVVWPDTSLGCPETGGRYQPAETKGHVLTFMSRGRSFEYHADPYRVIPCPPVEPE